MSSEITAIVAKALDIESLRHEVIASNVANATVKGYSPLTLDFEGLLSDVAKAYESSKGNVESLRAELSEIDESKALERSEMSEGVLLDVEMSKMVDSNIRYQTLITAMKQLGSIKKSAINGGSR